MNFLSAVKEMKKGYKVRRHGYPDMEIYKESHIGNTFLVTGMHSDHLEANDWVVINKNTDDNWVLKNQTTLYNKHESVVGRTLKDIKKLRELIIKDLDEDLKLDSALNHKQREIWHNWFKKIVNGRFGDL